MFTKKVFHIGLIALVLGVCGAMAAGAVALGGFGAAINRSNTLSFCISCHEMADNNYAEYKDTIHSKNRTGVKAICSDCHVPHDVVGLVLHKAGALRDLMFHFEGTIDTRQKFVDHRLAMAKKVWIHMKQTDSQECRNCHDQAAMEKDMQGRTAQKQHQQLYNGSGATCIDCHYGIAHKQPPGGLEPDDVMAELKDSK